ncbi:MAG: CehA/McbA family metallohydrolase, partial [Chloroflexota bacterium]|nr:CehA/McbA family metallohydrolase [Chloroflexota bacterium]
MSALLFQRRDHLQPAQARRSLAWPFTVPAGIVELRMRLAFWPAQVGTIRNLLTITLFDPSGFRGAGHRHAPQQEIVITPDGATPGFLPGELTPGTWTVEVDCHCVLPSETDGVTYELEVTANETDSPPAGEGDPGHLPPTVAAPTEGAAPHSPIPTWMPDRSPVDTLRERNPGAGGRTGRRDGGLNLRSVSQVGPIVFALPRHLEGAKSGLRWLKGDLHLHSNHSDGRWGVNALAHYAAVHQLDFIALTDHNTVSGRDDLAKALADAGLTVTLIPSMELTTYHGHANALGVEDWIDWRVAAPPDAVDLAPISSSPPAPDVVVPGRTMGEAAADIRRRGGTFVINHPRSPGYPACTGCHWEFGAESAGYADVLEVWNGPWGVRGQNSEALALWDGWLNAGHRLPGVAGSDGHTVPQRPEQLGFTYAFAAPHPTSVLTAVRAGRTYLSAGPALVWRDPLPGAPLPPGADEVTVDVSGLVVAADLCLVANGETVERRALTADDTVSFRLPPAPESGQPRWVRLELYREHSSTLLA